MLSSTWTGVLRNRVLLRVASATILPADALF